MAQPTEAESLAAAEAAREQWKAPSFLKELFLGRLRLDLIDPFPRTEPTPGFDAFYARMEAILKAAPSAEIDRTGEYPADVLQSLREAGAFGMKIPKEYGGCGFTQAEYDRVMKLLGRHDANLTALLSAHQSIGAPQPLKMFGSPEQKKKYLPRLAAGAISAFALTEPNVGSDPARMETTVSRTPEGDYILDGRKLWCTNGTLAEIIVVMARHADTGKLSAFIVETKAPGLEVVHRCRFMGLRALANAVIDFKDVRVSKDDLVGKEGEGLKIALVTLNTGRLALPAASVGVAKKCLEIVREWSAARVQWGHPIGKHEAIARKLHDMAATVFAMEAVADLGSRLAGRPGVDIRLEAAAAKEFNTVQGWRILDDTLQVRGGRGYENESSLQARGEEAVPVERMMRDFRINLIFEGSSEIMHLFMAREAVDRHLAVAGTLIDPKAGPLAKLAALPGIGAFYAGWYTGRLLGWSFWPRFGAYGALAPHVRFIERACRRLARQTFHAMLVHRAALQRKQSFLFRLVDIGLDLYAMSAAVVRARSLQADRHPSAAEAVEMAGAFCRLARRRVERTFRELWRNDDARAYRLAQGILKGEQRWLEAPFLDDAPSSGAAAAPAVAAPAAKEPSATTPV